MPQTNPFDQFDGAATTITTRRDPLAVRRDDRADRADARSADAAARAADAANRSATNEATRLQLERERIAREERNQRQQQSQTTFTQANQLRNSYETLPSYKGYMQALPGYAAGLASKGDPAGDLNLTYAYAKVMDPNSVVREGEQAAVAGGDIWVNSTAAQLQKQLGSGGTFQPAYRQRLREEMANRMGQLNQALIADRVRYKETAQRAGIDPRDVVGEHPGARYQGLSEQVLGRKQQQLDYYGNPVASPTGDSPVPPGLTGMGPGGGGAPQIATGSTKTEANPQVEMIIDSMARAGRNADEISKAIEPFGAPPIDPKQLSAVQEWAKSHPDYKGSLAIANREVPTSQWSRGVGSSFGTGVYAGVDGALGGSTDEIAGGINTAIFGGNLSDNVAAANAKKQAAFAENPKASFIGQGVGALGTMYGLGTALKGAGFASRLANPALAGDIGFGIGSGVGQSNDNRLIGGALGGAGAFAGNFAGNLVSSGVGAAARTAPGLAAVNGVRGMFGRLPGREALPPIIGADAPSAAQQVALGAIERAKVPDVVGSLTDAQAQNVPFTLADTSPSLGELAGAAARRSPAARDYAESVLLPRSRAQIDRLGQSVERNLGPIGNTLELSNGLRDQARAAADPLYTAAYAVPGRTSPELESLANTPFGREAMGKARTIAANERRDPNKMGFDLNDQGEVVLTGVPSMQTIDYAKRGMDDVLEQYRDKTTNRLMLSDAGRAQNTVKNQFLKEADTLVPEYGAARKAYQGPMESLDAMHRGQDFYSPQIGPNQVAAAVPDLSPEHLAQTQLGYRDAIMTAANRARFSSNPFESTLGTPQAEAKLGALYPDNPGVPNLLRQRDMEARMAQTATRVVGGSQTAGRQVQDQVFAPNPMIEGGLHAGAAVLTGGASLPASFGRVAASGLKDRMALGFGRSAERKAEDLGPMLLNPNPAQNLALIQRLMAEAEARKAFIDQTTPRLGIFGRALGSQAAVLPVNR